MPFGGVGVGRVARGPRSVGQIALAGSVRSGERGEDAAPLIAVRARRHGVTHRVVDEHDADGVALPEQEERERSTDALRVRELGQACAAPASPGGCARPVHRPARVEDERGAQVGFFLELFDDPAIGPCRDPPVEVAQVVAGLIGAVLGEFRRESAARRAVKAGQEAVHDPARDDFEIAKGGESGGIGEIRAERRHAPNA